MAKKIALFFGILLVVAVAAVLVIPFVVDVDKYRPQLVSAVNDRINGKLELGKLKLSLWGQIRVEIAAADLRDAAGRPVFSMKDAYIHLPLGPLVTGSPTLVLHAEEPAIQVIKGKDGRLNVSGLMKPAVSAAENPSPAAGGGGGGPTQVPGIIARARIGVRIERALLSYRDETSGIESKTRLEVGARDISLTHPTEFEVRAGVDTKLGKTGKINGPVVLQGTLVPKLVNDRFNSVALKARLNADDLEILMPGLFEKKKGIAANARISAMASPREASIDSLELRFHNASVSASASVANLVQTAEGGAANPTVRFSLKSNPIELKPWAGLLPPLREYELGGTARIEASAEGPAQKLNYKADFEINALNAKSPHLKAQPRIDAAVKISTDQIESLTLTMNAPGNLLRVTGKVVSFTAPQAQFQIMSTGMDLDQLIAFPAPAASVPSPAPGAEGGKSGAGEAADYDAMLDVLRENRILAATRATVSVSLASLRVRGIRMEEVAGRLYLRDLAAGVEKFGMKLLGGKLAAQLEAQLKPKAPTYQFNLSADSIDLKQAVESQFALFKNTLLGRAAFRMEGSGASLNPESALPSLRAKGNMKVEKAVFATIDVGRMVSEALNSAVERIAQKYPQIKDRKLGVPAGRQSRYSLVSSDFTIADGRFSAPNFAAKAEPQQGIDIKGSTVVGLKDYSLKTDWQIIDTYNLTQARDLGIDVAGTRVEHILSEGGRPVTFAVSAGCTVSKPCYSYTQVPEALAKVAFGNLAGAAQGRLKSEVKKRAETILQGAPPAVQQGIEGLRKRFFK